MVSKRYEVHDYWGYKASGSATFSSSSTTANYIYDLNGIGDCEITCTLKSPNKGFGLAYTKFNPYQSPSKHNIGVDGGNYLMASTVKADGTETNYASSLYQQYSTNTDLNVGIRIENGVTTLKIGTHEYTTTNVSDLRYLAILSWNNTKTINYSNLIIKKL